MVLCRIILDGRSHSIGSYAVNEGKDYIAIALSGYLS